MPLSAKTTEKEIKIQTFDEVGNSIHCTKRISQLSNQIRQWSNNQNEHNRILFGQIY